MRTIDSTPLYVSVSMHNQILGCKCLKFATVFNAIFMGSHFLPHTLSQGLNGTYTWLNLRTTAYLLCGAGSSLALGTQLVYGPLYTVVQNLNFTLMNSYVT